MMRAIKRYATLAESPRKAIEVEYQVDDTVIVTGYRFFAGWFDHDDEGFTIAFVIDVETWPLSDSELLKIALDMAQFCRPVYGYRCDRRMTDGPIYYPFGIIAGLDRKDEEREQISRWRRRRETSGPPTYLTNLFRDVYPVNFLSPTHLQRQIGDTTLREWIAAHPRRGTLSENNDASLIVWRIPERSRPQVRKALATSGLLIAEDEKAI